MGYLKKSNVTALFLVLVLVIVCQLICLPRQSDLKGAQIVAGKDFGAYWAAFQLFKNKKNPYVPEEIQKIQRELKCINIAPTVWNPPWTFLLLSPVLSLDFYMSSYLWIFCNFVLLFLISFIAWKILAPKTVTIPACMLAGSFCAPVYWNFAFGQLSLLITFGLVGSFWAIQKKKDYLAGFFLVLVTMKPHLVYLIMTLLGLWIVMNRRWKIILSSAVCLFSLCFLTWVQSPKVFFYWVNIQSDPLLHGTNTFVTFIRSQLGYLGHLAWPEPRWPVIFVPLATAVYFIFRFSICGRKIDWTKDLPPLICVSLLTAPYGYTFDQSLLMITQITIIVLIIETPISVMNRIEIIFWLSLLNIGVVLLSIIDGFNIEGFNKDFFLFPALLLLIWMRAVQLVKLSI